jgi:hypothetical protein
LGQGASGAFTLEFQDADKAFDPQAVYGAGKKPSGT